MKVEITYTDSTKRNVTISDEMVLALALQQADYEDMKAREAAKKLPASVKATT